MTTIHILNKSAAINNLQMVLKANDNEDSFKILALDDYLNIGPLQTEELTFSEGRNAFRNKLSANGEVPPIEDLERLMTISTRLSNKKEIRLCFWLAANARDLCTYHWLLHNLKKHVGRLYIINITGLPFLDEDNQLFYPNVFSALPPKEIAKTLSLCRKISSSEWETGREVWLNLQSQNDDLRILSRENNLEGVPIDTYDAILLDQCSEQAKNIDTLIRQSLKIIEASIPKQFLEFRLKELAQMEKIQLTDNKVLLKRTLNNEGEQS